MKVFYWKACWGFWNYFIYWWIFLKLFVLVLLFPCFIISWSHPLLLMTFFKTESSIKPPTHFFPVHVQLVSFSIVWYSLRTWECGSHLGFISLLHMGLHVGMVTPLWKSHRHLSWQFDVMIDSFIPKVWLSYRHGLTRKKITKIIRVIQKSKINVQNSKVRVSFFYITFMGEWKTFTCCEWSLRIVAFTWLKSTRREPHFLIL